MGSSSTSPAMTVKIGLWWFEKYRSKRVGRGVTALVALLVALFLVVPAIAYQVAHYLLDWPAPYYLFFLMNLVPYFLVEGFLVATGRWGMIDFAPGVISIDLSGSAFSKRW